MITFLILIAPLPLLILYGLVRKRLRQRKLSEGESQFPLGQEKPYEAPASWPPNVLLRSFCGTTRLYLRQQWTIACFGFVVSLWIFTVLLCGGLMPPFADKLPLADQQVWLSFMTGVSVWSAGLPAFIGIFAAVFAAVGIVTAHAVYTRTRPLPLRVIFWGRMLPALATLLLAAGLSMLIAFGILRLVYGPVWKSVPLKAMTSEGSKYGLFNLDTDETTEQAQARQLEWLGQSPLPRVLASSVTTMMLSFSIMVLLFCQPFGANKKNHPG